MSSSSSTANLLSLPQELLLPVLNYALEPLPNCLPTAHSLALTHPRLLMLTLHILRAHLSKYDSLGPNGLLPHPYSNRDADGNVKYPTLMERRRQVEKIFEYRWCLRVLPKVVRALEKSAGEVEGREWEELKTVSAFRSLCIQKS